VTDEQEKPCLVHTDLHPGNIRLRENDFALAGVLDFEHAKGWLAEYDLALLHWHLGEDLWPAFREGYGTYSPKRLRLFEVIKLLMIIEGRDLQHLYGKWACEKLATLF